MGFLNQPITLQSQFGTKWTIGEIQAQVVTSEQATDVLTITKQPVQIGVPVTDHSYLEPTELTLNILEQDTNFISGLLSTFNQNGLAQLYSTFLQLQSSKQPFDVITPKRLYKNMLIASIGETTDKTTQNILALRLHFQQIITVSVLTAQVPRNLQRNAGKTGATQPAGRKSFLASVKQATQVAAGVPGVPQ